MFVSRSSVHNKLPSAPPVLPFENILVPFTSSAPPFEASWLPFGSVRLLWNRLRDARWLSESCALPVAWAVSPPKACSLNTLGLGAIVVSPSSMQEDAVLFLLLLAAGLSGTSFSACLPAALMCTYKTSHQINISLIGVTSTAHAMLLERLVHLTISLCNMQKMVQQVQRMQSCASIRGAHQQPVMWSTDNHPQSTDSNSTIKCCWLESTGYGAA